MNPECQFDDIDFGDSSRPNVTRTFRTAISSCCATQIPGGAIEDSKVLRGVMINKDIVHPKMRRRIENPRVMLLDCNLEYKKGESQTNIEFTKEEDFM